MARTVDGRGIGRGGRPSGDRSGQRPEPGQECAHALVTSTLLGAAWGPTCRTMEAMSKRRSHAPRPVASDGPASRSGAPLAQLTRLSDRSLEQGYVSCDHSPMSNRRRHTGVAQLTPCTRATARATARAATRAAARAAARAATRAATRATRAATRAAARAAAQAIARATAQSTTRPLLNSTALGSCSSRMDRAPS